MAGVPPSPPGAAGLLDRMGGAAGRAARLVLIGDSLTQQTFDALRVQLQLEGAPAEHLYHACALQAPPPPPSTARVDPAPPWRCSACACPAGLRSMKACPEALQPGWCVAVRTLVPIPVPQPRGSGRSPARPTVTLLLAYLHHLPPHVASADAMAQVREEWPAWNQSVGRFPEKALPPGLVARFVAWADLAVVNVGTHYDFLPRLCVRWRSVAVRAAFLLHSLFISSHPFFSLLSPPHSLFDTTVHWLRDLLVADAAAHPGKRHVWRSTYPSHWRDAPGSPRDRYCMTAACDAAALALNAPPHWSNAAAGRILAGSGVAFVPSLPGMRAAGQLHSTERAADGGPVDCLHWCFAWELFAPVWAGIADRWAGK